MWKIREQQLAALRLARREDLARRVASYVADRRLSSPAPLEQRVAAANELIGRANGYGIVTEAGVIAFVDLTLRHGPDFDTAGRIPWIGPILLSALSEGQKLAMIEQRMRAPQDRRRR